MAEGLVKSPSVSISFVVPMSFFANFAAIPCLNLSALFCNRKAGVVLKSVSGLFGEFQ